MEETLTVHRLHVPMQLRKTMASTNVIRVGVSRSSSRFVERKTLARSDQRERWVGSGLLVAEKQFAGFRDTSRFRLQIKELKCWRPLSRRLSTEKGVVEWITRESLLSTDFRRSRFGNDSTDCGHRFHRGPAVKPAGPATNPLADASQTVPLNLTSRPKYVSLSPEVAAAGKARPLKQGGLCATTKNKPWDVGSF